MKVMGAKETPVTPAILEKGHVQFMAGLTWQVACVVLLPLKGGLERLEIRPMDSASGYLFCMERAVAQGKTTHTFMGIGEWLG